MACLAHRKVREGPVTLADAALRRDWFFEDLNSGVITVVPVSDRLLRKVEAATRTLPQSCYLRSVDALHLVTAAECGAAFRLMPQAFLPCSLRRRFCK